MKHYISRNMYPLSGQAQQLVAFYPKGISYKNIRDDSWYKFVSMDFRDNGVTKAAKRY